MGGRGLVIPGHAKLFAYGLHARHSAGPRSTIARWLAGTRGFSRVWCGARAPGSADLVGSADLGRGDSGEPWRGCYRRGGGALGGRVRRRRSG
ncbi:hypothetical protein, partial [Microtetraspora sp. AC03309]|uniref:hypothetical protein n=1 Tax=Microtetraspora sp. AC03309 TaxID=2779376 RepID=UPI001E3A4315